MARTESNMSFNVIDFTKYAPIELPSSANGGALLIDMAGSGGFVEDINLLVVAGQGDIKLQETLAHMLFVSNKAGELPSESASLQRLWNRALPHYAQALVKYQVHSLAEASEPPMRLRVRRDDCLTEVGLKKRMGDALKAYMEMAGRMIAASVADRSLAVEVRKHTVYCPIMYAVSATHRLGDSDHNFKGDQIDRPDSLAHKLVKMAGADQEGFHAWAREHGHDFAHYLQTSSLIALTYAMIGEPFYGNDLQHLPRSEEALAKMLNKPTVEMSDRLLTAMIPIVNMSKVSQLSAGEDEDEGSTEKQKRRTKREGKGKPKEEETGEPEARSVVKPVVEDVSKEMEAVRAAMEAEKKVKDKGRGVLSALGDVLGFPSEEKSRGTAKEGTTEAERAAAWEGGTVHTLFGDEGESGDPESKEGLQAVGVKEFGGDRKAIRFAEFFVLPQSVHDRFPPGQMGQSGCINGNSMLTAMLHHVASRVSVPSIADISRVFGDFSAKLKLGTLKREQMLIIKEQLTPIYAMGYGYCNAFPELRALANAHQSLIAIAERDLEHQGIGGVLAEVVKTITADPDAAKNTIADALMKVQDVSVALAAAIDAHAPMRRNMAAFDLYEDAEKLTANKKRRQAEYEQSLVAAQIRALNKLDVGEMEADDVMKFLALSD